MPKMGVVARVEIKVSDGRRYVAKNLITNVGLAQIAGLLNGEETDAAKYIALGTGNSPADPGDIDMEEEVASGGGERVLGTLSRQTTTVLDDTALISAEFDLSIDLDLTELGLFSAISGGVLFSHLTFSPVAVSNGQSLIINWTYAVEEIDA